MRNSSIFAAVMATSALIVASTGAANAGREDKPAASYASRDGKSEVRDGKRQSYKAVREHRRTVTYKRTKRERQYAYPYGPWGPFAGPPGLF